MAISSIKLKQRIKMEKNKEEEELEYHAPGNQRTMAFKPTFEGKRSLRKKIRGKT